jgi:hypothetical protein
VDRDLEVADVALHLGEAPVQLGGEHVVLVVEVDLDAAAGLVREPILELVVDPKPLDVHVHGERACAPAVPAVGEELAAPHAEGAVGLLFGFIVRLAEDLEEPLDLLAAAESLAVVDDEHPVGLDGDLDLGGAGVCGVHDRLQDRLAQRARLAADHVVEQAGVHGEGAALRVLRGLHRWHSVGNGRGGAATRAAPPAPVVLKCSRAFRLPLALASRRRRRPGLVLVQQLLDKSQPLLHLPEILFASFKVGEAEPELVKLRAHFL